MNWSPRACRRASGTGISAYDRSVAHVVLVPGAGGSGWYWHQLIAELHRRGHDAIAVQLPGSDPDAGLPEYCDLITAAIRDANDPVVVVAQSLGGFSAPLACEQAPVKRLVLVNAMIPQPGESAGEWWDAVGWQAAAQASADEDGRPAPDVRDLDTLFLHDLPHDLAETMRSNPEVVSEAERIFHQPWPLAHWPNIPTTILAGREDRLFPVALQRRVARERLGQDVHELPGGHLLALSQPAALADRITNP